MFRISRKNIEISKSLLIIGLSMGMLAGCTSIEENTEDYDADEQEEVVKEQDTQEEERAKSQEAAQRRIKEQKQRDYEKNLVSSEDDVYRYLNYINSKYFTRDSLQVWRASDSRSVTIEIPREYKTSFQEFIYHVQYENEEYKNIWAAYINSIVRASEILSEELGIYSIAIQSPSGYDIIFRVTDGLVEEDSFNVAHYSVDESDNQFYEMERTPEYPEFEDVAAVNTYINNELINEEIMLIWEEDESVVIAQPLGETRDRIVELAEALQYSDDRYEEWLEYEKTFLNLSDFIGENISATTRLLIIPDFFNEDGSINIETAFKKNRNVAVYINGRASHNPLNNMDN